MTSEGQKRHLSELKDKSKLALIKGFTLRPWKILTIFFVILKNGVYFMYRDGQSRQRSEILQGCCLNRF